MWTTTKALVLLLLTVDLQVNGAVEKTGGSVAEHPKPEDFERMDSSKGIDNTPASKTSADFKGSLLVIPMDGSHWIDLKAVAQEMGRRGHRVTVVMPEVSMRMGPGKHFDTVFFPVPYNMSAINSLLNLNKNLIKKDESSFYENISKRFGQIKRIKDFIHTTAESLLFNTSLISHLAQQVSPTTPMGKHPGFLFVFSRKITRIHCIFLEQVDCCPFCSTFLINLDHRALTRDSTICTA